MQKEPTKYSRPGDEIAFFAHLIHFMFLNVLKWAISSQMNVSAK